jgi:hypothetical protein
MGYREISFATYAQTTENRRQKAEYKKAEDKKAEDKNTDNKKTKR